MSLINQALRKAQRDRTPNRMAQPGEQNSASYASSTARGMSPMIVIGLVISLAVLIGLVIGLSIVIFKGDTTPPTQIATATPAPAPAKTASLAPSKADKLIPQPSTTPKTTTTAQQSAPNAPNVVDELRKAREAAEAEATAQAKAETEAAEAKIKAAAEKAKVAELAAARAAAKPSEDIIKWLGAATLSGVRLSEKESKVILNGKAYAVGEFVNFKLGLKVLAVQESRVLFGDSNDKKYMKRL